MSRMKPRFVLIYTVSQLKKYHSTASIDPSYIALTINYLRLHVKGSCRTPKPIADECVSVDNSRGGYSTADKWRGGDSTAAYWATQIREAGSQSVNKYVILHLIMNLKLVVICFSGIFVQSCTCFSFCLIRHGKKFVGSSYIFFSCQMCRLYSIYHASIMYANYVL